MLFILSGCACLKLSSNIPFVCVMLCALKAWWAPQTPGSHRGSTLLVNAFLCSHFAWNFLSDRPQHHSFSPSISRPLSPACEVCDLCNFILLVTRDRSRSGQWILMSSFGLRSIKARHRYLRIPRLRTMLWRADTCRHRSSLSLTGQGLR